MKLETILSMDRQGVSFDTETYLMVPGNKIPPLVCGSVGWLEDDGTIAGEILDKEQAMHIFAQLLDDKKKVIVGANITFDLSVMALHAAKLGVDIMPAIYRVLLDEERVYDLQLAEALHAVAQGHLGLDPRTMGQIKNSDGRPGRYSLYACVDMVLGRQDAKVNDEYRLRYGELDQIPFDLWPQNAKDYPIDDARNTIECALAQTGHVVGCKIHRFVVVEGEDSRCADCGSTTFGTPCRVKRRHRNLHDLANQVGTQFALHMAGSWGLHINQESVDKIERETLRNQEGADLPFIKLGILRSDGSQDLATTKKRVALAYGAKDPCPVCRGTGKVPSPKAKTVRCRSCRGASAATKYTPSVLAWKAGNPEGCPDCNNKGEYLDPTSLVVCYLDGVDEETGKPVKLKTCDGTGLVLISNVPRSEKEGVSYGRDALNDSGDEDLIALADYQLARKDLEVYIPFFRRARMPVAGHAPECPHLPSKMKEVCTCHAPGCPSTRNEQCTCQQRGFYKSIPLTLWPNTIVETGRVSYDGIIQLIKRASGYTVEVDGKEEYIPSLRECFEARKGMLYSSTDYEAGELVTLAEVCNRLVGYSDLGDALLSGKKPHNMLGASMIGMAYEEYEKRAKEPMCKDARQAAKAANFGFPGGAGAATLVLQKRKEAIDTPCEGGPHEIEDDDGNPIRGYKGLRFCILMEKATACGVEKTTVWRDRQIPPTCVRCIECALRLKDFWAGQWSEMKHYFNYVQECVEQGMLITEEMLTWWPHLRPWFTPGQRLAPGEVMQLVSGRIRGGVTFTSGANGFFQGLLADACKAALRRCSRECYDRTIVVPEKLYHNSNPSKYAGRQSPLVGSRAIVFAHDEIIFEHPEHIAHDAVMRVSEIMVDCLRYYCPTVADACKAEPTLMRKWYKNATKVVHRGKVVPWTPEHKEKTCAECKLAA